MPRMWGADMTQRSGIRRWIKWSGLGLSLLIAVIWAVSLFMWPRLYCNHWCASLYKGGFSVEWSDDLLNEGLSFNVRAIQPRRWYWQGMLPAPYEGGFIGTITTGLLIPLILPFLLVALPTAFLFWRDRRKIFHGYCQKCGFNLTGNTSGICPECGERI
jgi:hypothetical protein